jgi:uncharacterized protein
MFIKRGKWAFGTMALLTVLAVVAGCTSAPASPQVAPAAPAASPTAAPSSEGQAGGSAVPLDGAWKGEIEVAGQVIGIQLNFKGQGGTIDLPTQGARGLRMENFSSQGNQVTFEMLPNPRTATFTGTVEGDKMSGPFEQAGAKGTWNATREATAASAPTSKPAEGYKDEEVTFKNGRYTLAGTLSIPDGAGPHPAIILISGSGAQNRDEELFGFKPFAILADALAKKGIAVLRYDDRGIGGSTTGTMDDTSETFAADVSSAYDYLKTRSEINPKKIGLLGHSEGGIIAPMVAVNKGDVAFLVLLAGTGEPGKDVLLAQSQAILKASGADAATVAQNAVLEKEVIDAAVTGQGLDQVRSDLVKAFKASVEQLPEDQRKQLGDIDQWAQKRVDEQMLGMQGPWMKFFLTHDPAPVLEKVHAPVLALFGTKDVQVLAATNEPAVKAALEKGGNKDVTTKVFPDANHLFQAAQTGSPTEYATLKPEFAPGVVDTITSWVVEHTK